MSAYVSNNPVPVSRKFTNLMRTVLRFAGWSGDAGLRLSPKRPLVPAVPVKSRSPDYIVCLEDGKRSVSKRHLRSKYDLSPEQYPRALESADRLSDGTPNYIMPARLWRRWGSACLAKDGSRCRVIGMAERKPSYL